MRTATMLLAVVVLLSGCATAPMQPNEAGDLQAGAIAFMRGDYATALKTFRPLAEQGNAKAQTIMGVLYDRGLEVPQDDTEAVRWYRLAAEQRNAEAQVFLGGMYALGRGVPQDVVQGHLWLTLAAAQGHEEARKARDLLAEKMTPAQRADAQRLAREWTPKSK